MFNRNVLAAIILSSKDSNIKEMSDKVVELEEQGVEITPEGLHVGRTVGGWYSRDLEMYIGQLLSFGEGRYDENNKFQLYKSGRELLEEAVYSSLAEDEPDVRRICEIVGLNYSKILRNKNYRKRFEKQQSTVSVRERE